MPDCRIRSHSFPFYCYSQIQLGQCHCNYIDPFPACRLTINPTSSYPEDSKAWRIFTTAALTEDAMRLAMSWWGLAALAEKIFCFCLAAGQPHDHKKAECAQIYKSIQRIAAKTVILWYRHLGQKHSLVVVPTISRATHPAGGLADSDQRNPWINCTLITRTQKFPQV